MHKHETHCYHELRYCSKCDEVYCKKCYKEWKNNLYMGWEIGGNTCTWTQGDLITNETNTTNTIGGTSTIGGHSQHEA